MNVLIVGGGGREHALARAIAKSPHCASLFIAPGNPGTAGHGRNVAIDVARHTDVIAFCLENAVDFVVIGPEAPLVAGLVDDLERAGISAFGPNRAAAQLEGSKGFTKELCAQFRIPTAAYRRFDALSPALDYLRETGAPIVVKADGLAAGKGVTVATTIAEAEDALRAIFGGAFGAAGASVVIEEMLEGEEVSLFALCDGARALAFASAQDHKRVFDGDLGPNTGGMGAYSPAPVMTDAMTTRAMREIVEPALRGMQERGTPFRGLLFAGLMLTPDGPKLIEFNARFGDPETQAILPRVEDDLLLLLHAAATGTLSATSVRLSAQHALCVVMAAQGYPEAPRKGTKIRGQARAAALSNVIIDHAGTKQVDDELVADGGRVLGVTGLAGTLADAQARAYAAVDCIDWPGGFCRRDIGWRALRNNG